MNMTTEDQLKIAIDALKHTKKACEATISLYTDNDPSSMIKININSLNNKIAETLSYLRVLEEQKEKICLNLAQDQKKD